MKTFHLASYNRASEGAIATLKKEMSKKGMLAPIDEVDYIIAVGDRIETYDVVLDMFRKKFPIIHLWAGEISQGTEDEVYRHSMTLMSMMQLCTNFHALRRVCELCSAVNKTSNAYVVGNVMLDDLSVDESVVPTYPYNLVLYNPPTLLAEEEIIRELKEIEQILAEKKLQYIWIEPNHDKHSDLIDAYVTHFTFPRKQFLGLIKHCQCFITNSSCQYYEAPFLTSKDKITSIGERNKDRESKYADMTEKGATKKIIKILESL